MKKCILMLGVSESLLDSVTKFAHSSGYQVLPAFSPSIAGWLVAQRRFALVVVNVEHFQTGIYELLAKVREHHQAPIVALCDKTFLTMGELKFDVDLTLSTHLHPRKMVAYFVALMKRHQGDLDFIAPKPLDGWPIEQGDFFVDQLLGWTLVGERSVDLSPKENRLLVYFLLRAGQTLSRQTVCTALWIKMGGYGCDDRMLVEELRGKIEIDPNRPLYLRNVPSGYVFCDTAPSALGDSAESPVK